MSAYTRVTHACTGWDSCPNQQAHALMRALTAAVAERDALAAKVAAIEALFAGGPDTPCRTLWRAVEGLVGRWDEIECVEVPLDDLRAALASGDQC